MDRDTELRWVARLKAGDTTAFEIVYEAFRPRLYSFLVRLSRRTDVAEDLMEETWLRLVTGARELADDTRLAAWLFTVARNSFVSWLRHRALDDERISELTPSWPLPDPSETPFEAAARNEMEQRLEKALARLSIRDREVLLLVTVEEMRPSEVASILGLSPEVIRKRLQRARERLTEAMQEDFTIPFEKVG